MHKEDKEKINTCNQISRHGGGTGLLSQAAAMKLSIFHDNACYCHAIIEGLAVQR